MRMNKADAEETEKMIIYKLHAADALLCMPELPYSTPNTMMCYVCHTRA